MLAWLVGLGFTWSGLTPFAFGRTQDKETVKICAVLTPRLGQSLDSVTARFKSSRDWRRERSERDRSRRSCCGRWHSHKARTGMPDGDSKRCNDFNKPKEQGHHSAVTAQPPRGRIESVVGSFRFFISRVD